eukprot:TRINITY_DN3832_c0_g1_i1.p1 TRINITY_DN3832_c0_g1~~TRINITY_DN3832_c0_g1_i1.p1  ORF type:complete len:477 (-),score=92.98 TRINITY_DN3832_c0_g1_i1:85-1515(-)
MTETSLHTQFSFPQFPFQTINLPQSTNNNHQDQINYPTQNDIYTSNDNNSYNNILFSNTLNNATQVSNQEGTNGSATSQTKDNGNGQKIYQTSNTKTHHSLATLPLFPGSLRTGSSNTLSATNLPLFLNTIPTLFTYTTPRTTQSPFGTSALPLTAVRSPSTASLETNTQEDDEGQNSSGLTGSKRRRGSYKCSKCGLPKKGHVCSSTAPLSSTISPEQYLTDDGKVQLPVSVPLTLPAQVPLSVAGTLPISMGTRNVEGNNNGQSVSPELSGTTGGSGSVSVGRFAYEKLMEQLQQNIELLKFENRELKNLLAIAEKNINCTDDQIEPPSRFTGIPPTEEDGNKITPESNNNNDDHRLILSSSQFSSLFSDPQTLDQFQSLACSGEFNNLLTLTDQESGSSFSPNSSENVGCVDKETSEEECQVNAVPFLETDETSNPVTGLSSSQFAISFLGSLLSPSVSREEKMFSDSAIETG